MSLTLYDGFKQEMVDLTTNGVDSDQTRRAYERGVLDFLDWYEGEGRPDMQKSVVEQYRRKMQQEELSASTINVRLSAIRRMFREAADNGMIPGEAANAIANVKGISTPGNTSGRWLTKTQAQALLDLPDRDTLKGKRDLAALAILLGCGLRRQEAVDLTFEHVQQREGRWVIVDIVGKRNKTRTVPMASWVKAAIDAWAEAAGINEGPVLRNTRGLRPISTQTVHNIVLEYSGVLGEEVSAHDLRRTFARMARKGGASLEQLRLNLGHSHVKTTEAYVGAELDLENAPSDLIDLTLKRDS